MNSFQIILGQLIQLFIMIAIGFLTARLKIVTQESLPQLSRIITMVLLPLYVFTYTLNNVDFFGLAFYLPAVLGILAMYLGLSILFRILSFLLPIPRERKNLFQAVFIFGNTAMMGIPLLAALDASKSGAFIAFLLTIDTLFLWTYGVALVSGERIKIEIKRLLNPALLLLALAVLFLVLGIRLPESVQKALNSVGSTASPLCLIYIGMLCYFSDIRKVLRCWEMYIGIGIKMVAVPILLAFLLQKTFLEQQFINMLVLTAGLPTVTIMPLLAKTYGGNSDYASGVTMCTILISIVTLPAISYLVIH